MEEHLKEHPVLVYLTFIAPAALLALGMAFKANVLLLLFAIVWLGVSLTMFFLPIASDDGSSS
jgi:hypothetical protein